VTRCASDALLLHLRRKSTFTMPTRTQLPIYKCLLQDFLSIKTKHICALGEVTLVTRLGLVCCG
jgi:hypothetical protein